jgi:Glucodextranase, domain B/PASTA domain
MGIKRLLAFCLLAGLVLAAPADAAFTASSISVPRNGAEMFFNGDNGAGNVTVRGTVTGTASGLLGAKGDLVCYTVSDTKLTKVASGVDVSSGAFAINASLSPIAGFACRLALIPAGTSKTGNAAAPFVGPAISVSDQFSHSSAGSLFGYYILVGTLPWSFAFQSLGDCPVTTSFATDPSTLGSFSLFAGNACLPRSSGVGPAAGTRSSLQVDGQNAYAPAAISSLSTQAGFEPLSYGALFNPLHDTVAINEVDTPTICDPPATFPPTTATCPSLHDSGIQVQQTTQLLPGGQVARVGQRFRSVDGRSHTIELLFSQAVQAPVSGESPGFQFPGQGSFATHNQPDSFATFPAGPSSIVAISNASGFLPATTNPIGAITFNHAPTSVDFTSAKGAQTTTFLMHYATTIPAGGSIEYDWSFSQASSSPALAVLEAVERDRFGLPTISISRPRNRATVRSALIRVQGHAQDAVGVSSVNVNGHGVPVAAGGAFLATVRVRKGKNTIRATAVNDAGNTSSKAITVTYKPPPCKVPRLRGKTLAGARRALANSGCALGHVHREHSRTVRKGRVVSSTPNAGAKHRNGTKVALVLSRGR